MKMIFIVALFSLVLATVILSSGCIKMITKSASGPENSVQPAGTTGTINKTGSSILSRPPSTEPVTLATLITPQQTLLVTEVPPIIPADPYQDIHGHRLNQTPEYNLLTREPEYTKTYTLRGNATGLLVNVIKGPLLIMFDVNPMYDCIESPSSCRGDKAKSVNRPYFICTVRNNETREIMAEDGYGREYSSQKTDREIKIFGEGQYHLTLSGNYLDVTLSIATGASPNEMNVSERRSTQAIAPPSENNEFE